ncbi:hypothetical protein AQUCO_08300073v1 [Aquilegia coerulea]|uniref:Cyclin N-terminal domain-containing protein n=1 Tax=Aquilegia coerulea TaxID=218851 RepID=A0A2G5C758_AQUCA|nr:hypothetical protein AQUCO_08300073v1 [Aquilegia coerulea]
MASLFDTLYCEEEHFEEEEVIDVEEDVKEKNPLFFLLEQDLFWENEQLISLFSKEQQQQQPEHHLLLKKNNLCIDLSLVLARKEAVQWMLKVVAHYGFSALTGVLAVNYLDRFMSSLRFQRDKPWMTQLASVACLSVAAKVEETQVPLLLDLQVEETKYVFEAKTIQRMELLVLSTLHWKMNPVTPLSFLDHIIRRLGLKTNLHWEFMKRCEHLLLSVIADSRSVCYLPSVLATATMLHVINQIETCNPIEYQNQLMDILKIDKEEMSRTTRMSITFVSASMRTNQAVQMV